jgi:hypothetical protein
LFSGEVFIAGKISKARAEKNLERFPSVFSEVCCESEKILVIPISA